MPYRFRKMNEVVTRVQRARSVATALRLAGERQAGGQQDLCWPDLIHVLENLLPTSDEMGEALDDIRVTDSANAL